MPEALNSVTFNKEGSGPLGSRGQLFHENGGIPLNLGKLDVF